MTLSLVLSCNTKHQMPNHENIDNTDSIKLSILLCKTVFREPKDKRDVRRYLQNTYVILNLGKYLNRYLTKANMPIVG